MIKLIATGGASYPRTGSTGEGYRLAQSVGHSVVPLRGSLVPLESDDACCAGLQGLSLRNVELRVKNEKGRTLFLINHEKESSTVVLDRDCRNLVDGKVYRSGDCLELKKKEVVILRS